MRLLSFIISHVYIVVYYDIKNIYSSASLELREGNWVLIRVPALEKILSEETLVGGLAKICLIIMVNFFSLPNFYSTSLGSTCLTIVFVELWKSSFSLQLLIFHLVNILFSSPFPKIGNKSIFWIQFNSTSPQTPLFI